MSKLIKIILVLIAIIMVLLAALVWVFNKPPADRIISKEAQNSLVNTPSEFEVANTTELANNFNSGKYFLPILNFHHVSEPAANAKKEDKIWYVSPVVFEKMMADLKNNDYQPIFLSDFYKITVEKIILPERAVVITFDDGNIDIYNNAYPILKKYNFKFVINIMTGVRGKNYLSSEQIIELAESGLVEFGSHTVYHQYLSGDNMEKTAKELKESKEYLENLLGREILIISYPFGHRDQQVIDIAKSLGYKIGLTIDWGKEQNAVNLMELKRYNILADYKILDWVSQ